jgi:hypothetical protein
MFAIEELDLLIEALSMSASRHESQARFRKPGAVATAHDEKAAAMRKLRVRLMHRRAGGPFTSENENR